MDHYRNPMESDSLIQVYFPFTVFAVPEFYSVCSPEFVLLLRSILRKLIAKISISAIV